MILNDDSYILLMYIIIMMFFFSYKLAEQQPVGRRVELKQESVSPSSD